MDKAKSVVFLLIILAITTACVSPPPSQNRTNNLSLFQEVADVTMANASPTENLTVHFFDVGLGDSELIRTPSGKTMLIDAGGNTYCDDTAGYLKRLNIQTLNVVVASNRGATNIGGMPEILFNFTAGDFVEGANTGTDYRNDHLRSLIGEKNVSYRTVKAGDTIFLDRLLTVTVLNPQSTFTSDSTRNSVVMKITYRNVSFLFMGDAWGDVESPIAESAGHTNILKVGYHGNSISTGREFLQKIRPEISIISANTETFGHRSPETIRRLEESGSQVYITDVNGTVTITSDGSTYTVITEK